MCDILIFILNVNICIERKSERYMLKVLIADDEWRVCKVIEKLIAWDELGLELGGIATTGIEECEMIESKKPDIIITDIRMPGMDGLQVIQRVKQQGCTANFIIVSGYKFFDYAYSAIKYGVEDYLLKPIQKEELNSILQKIVHNRKEKENFLRNAYKLETEKKMSQEVLDRLYLERVLNNEKITTEFKLKFEEKNYLCYSIIADAKITDEELLYSFAKVVYKRIKNIISQHSHCKNVMYNKRAYVFGILNYGADAEYGQNILCECFQNILEFVQNFSEYCVTFSIGNAFTDEQFINQEISRVKENLQARLVLGVNRIITEDSLLTGEKLDTILEEKDFAELEKIIISGDMQQIEYNLKEFFRKLNSIENPDFRQYYKIVSQIIKTVYEALNCNDELSATEKELQERITYFYQRNKLRDYVIHYLIGIINKYYELRKNSELKPIRVIKEYLKQHYAEKIGLEELADLVNLNAVYLSVLFKRSTGINFNDYLTRIRIDESKRYLKESNLSIYEIAEKVGYGNGKYFSQVFQKIVGISPSIYRKLHT